MTRDQKGRRAAFKAIAPLTVPPSGQPAKPDQPDDQPKAEDQEHPTGFSRSSHYS